MANQTGIVYQWESGIVTTTEATRNFYENFKEFRVKKANDGSNRYGFFDLDGNLQLVTSPAKDVRVVGGYVRIETANSTFHLWDPEHKYEKECV